MSGTTPIWPIEGVALDSTGDEVAGSLGVVTKAIKAVTDVIPDAGALTVPAADAAANVDWGDVIGNKSDLRESSDDREDFVLEEYAERFSKNLQTDDTGEIQYIETSALTGDKVEDAFEILIRKLVDVYGWK